MLVSRQNTLKAHVQGNYWLILVIVLLSLLAAGCEENQSAECEEIFQVAQDVQHSNQNISEFHEHSNETKNWLQAANTFSLAADRIALLEMNRSELIKYQNQLVTIYRIYSQATYDAVRARENKDLSTLQSARQDVIKAEVIQQKLIRDINTYCVNNR
ncbi:MAG: hypothetical protein HC930_14160 [Hydrococcus sp. SU_1_0]|nr:hypothetical protein [Hydrococcus sp. SU_1_0]